MHSTSDGLGSGASSLSTHKGVRKTMLQVRLHLLQQSSSFSLSQAASCPHCPRQSFPGVKASSTQQNEEESLWMRAEHIACRARNPWASWQMQECLAPLSLCLMAFASSENAPETSTVGILLTVFGSAT